MKPVIKIGLLGMGTVGTGVLKVLAKNGKDMETKIGRKIELGGVLVRNLTKKREIDIPPGLLTDNPSDILDNPEIDIIVEVMGTIDTAFEYIIRAFDNKKVVVTANKDLIAVHGKELFEAADRNGCDFFFEASVAGGIPIIRPLKECLCGNKISIIMGIINGTTNYILTKMSRENTDFQEALADAQRLGYAEPDPTADIEGYDAARKLAILASIGFNSRITYPDVYVEGITQITSYDIKYAEELGYALKLLGIAKGNDTEVEVRVHPVLIPRTHPLASVYNEFNAIFVQGDAVGETMFYGKGAGELPTASAVVGDIISAARNICFGVKGRIGCTCYDHKRIKPITEIYSKYYIRISVKDRPGVLASIAGVFGNSNVSLASVIQKRLEGDLAELVLITHQVEEANLRDALAVIEGLSVVAEVGTVLRVEGSEF